MATLERLRKRSGILLATVIGLALIAFVLQDLVSSGSSMFGENRTTVGEINGESIEIQQFQREVEQFTNWYKQNMQKSNIDAELRTSIRDETWDNLVHQHILKDEAEKIGLRVTTEELAEMIQGNDPHEIVKQVFTNQETGRFERQQVVNFIQRLSEQEPQIQDWWLKNEEDIERERLQTKFNNLFLKGIQVTDIEAKQRFMQNNKQITCSYIHLPWSSVSDSIFEVSNSEMKTYYKENLYKYKQEKTRDIYYVTFPIEPSSKDDSTAQAWIKDIKEDFVAAENTEQFISLNSDTSFNPDYFADGELPEEINDFMFNAEIGDVYGPYFDKGAYKLAKLADIEYLPDSVKARHILLQVKSQEEVESQRTLADSLKEAIENGAEFAALAAEYGTDATAQEGGDLGWVSSGEMVESFNDTIFFGSTDKIYVVPSRFGFHVVDIVEQSEKHKKVQVGLLMNRVDYSTETYQNIYSEAAKFAGENRKMDQFLDAAKENDYNIQQADNIKSNTRQIEDISNASDVVKWAYENKEEAVSGAIEIEDLFVVAAVKDVREEDHAPFEKVKDDIKANVIKQKKVAHFKEKVKEADAANIDQLAQHTGDSLLTAKNITFSSHAMP
ncbi:MAG: peptidylprolyl isomerase, partial [Thermotogota bacterium]